MNLYKFFYNLFIDQPNPPKYYYKGDFPTLDFLDFGSNVKEFMFVENRYIEASDLFLKEIELLVNGNDYLSKDKYKIQSLLKTFKEIEYNLNEINNYYGFIKGVKNLEEGCSKDMIENFAIASSLVERLRKFRSLFSDILERKRQVDQRLKELGRNFFLNNILKILTFYFNLRREYRKVISI